MNFLRRCVVTVGIALSLGAAATPARGDVFNDIAIGLDYAGFNFIGTQNVEIIGRENLLSGGADFLTSVNFPGTVLDFGPWDLTLQGPVSFAVSTGGRLLNTLDISFQTALSADAIATPLRYELELDSGNQLSTIGGTLLIDGDMSINGFGFYDLTFTYSSRQDVTRDGRYADDLEASDFDVGPIHVRGNLFADALALVAAPFFETAGQSNPFMSFSGSAQLKQILEAESSAALARLAADGDVFSNDARATLSLADTVDRPAARVGVGEAHGVIPEPPVLLLLLLGIPAMLVRRPRPKPLAQS